MRGPRTAMKSGPRWPQLEKALAQKGRPNTAKNKYKNKLKKKKDVKKKYMANILKKKKINQYFRFGGRWLLGCPNIPNIYIFLLSL